MSWKIGRCGGLALILAMLTWPATAMIPPHFQRLGDLQRIVNLPGLATALGVPIDRIESVGPGLYRITAGRCHVDVRMMPVPGDDGHGLRPRRYEPRAGQRICQN